MRPRGLTTADRTESIRGVVGARWAALTLGTCAAAIALTWLLWSTPALAHSDLIASRPSDGEALSEPVSRIELEFSGAIDPARTTVRVLDADGDVVPISAITHLSDELVAVEADEGLAGGRFAVLWSIRSASDGHEISGSFAFEVETGGDVGTGSETTSDPEPDVNATDGSSAATGNDPEPPATPTTTVAPTPTTVAAQPVGELLPTDGPAERPAASSDPTDLVGAVGRWASMLGSLLAIGAAAFAAFGLIGTRSEISRVVRWIRAAGVAVVAGTVIEVGAAAVSASGAAVVLDPIGILDALPTSLAYAAVLRLAGGIALVQSPTLVTTSSRTPDMAHVGAGAPVPDTPPIRDDSFRLVVREEWLILAGLAAIAVSYLLDGHSASLGLVGRAANLTHVIAGGVWLGGVIVLGDLTIRRNRSGVPTRLAETAVRFSHIATIALVGVATAGGALVWSMLDSPGELPSGTWGRVLLGKILLVVVAAGIGAYNHFRVVPGLDEDPERASTLARTLVAEGIVLVLVVAVTAALVASAQ